MRVFVASTPAELRAHRQAVCDTIDALGWEVTNPSDPSVWVGDSVADREERVASAELVLGLVGWRAGDWA